MAKQSTQHPYPASVHPVITPPPVSPAELAAYCLLKLGRVLEVETALSRAEVNHDDGPRNYYLGLALAHQGKIGEAVNRLQQACQHPRNEKVARQALLALLKRQVKQKIAQHEWDAAGVAIGEALGIDPDNSELQEMLLVLGSHLPVNYLKADKRAEAATTWEKAQKKDPTDGKITHCLALLYFWEAQTLETQGKRREAISAWQGAIRNWVSLSYNNNFWIDWARKREAIYGQIPKTAREGLRRKLEELLSRKIADYQNNYLTQQRTDDARRMSRLSLELSLELKSADALRQVAESLQQHGKKTNLSPPCGVLMLNHLGQLETAQKALALAEATQADEAGTDQLHWCLSPWAFPWIMVQERRYEEAIVHLEQELQRNTSSQEGYDLLATAYLEQGKLLAAAGELNRALETWQAALGHVRSRKNTGDEIRQEAEKAAVKEAMRLQREDDGKGLDKAIQLLEKVRGIADTQRIKENLSDLYTTLGIKEGNDESQSETARMTKAKKHMEKALELNRNNGRAKQNLAIILAGEGVELCNRDRYEEAIRLLRRAYDLAPSQAAGILSRALSAYGVYRWNHGNHYEGDRLLREALDIDPSNDHAHKNLRGR